MRQLFTISMILAYIEEKMYLLSINMKNFIAKKLIRITAAAAAKSLESCPTLCDPIDRSPPGSPVPGILQARTLEWVAISFSNAGKWKVRVKLLSRVWLFETPWTAAYQAPPSMGFPRQEYWSGVSLPSPTRITSRPKIPIFTGNWSSLKSNTSFLRTELGLILFYIRSLIFSIYSKLMTWSYWCILELISRNKGVYLPIALRKNSSILITPKLTHYFWLLLFYTQI